MHEGKYESAPEASRVDSVLISATCYLPNESGVTDKAREVAHKVVVRSDLTVAIRFGTVSVDSDDAEYQDVHP